MEPSTTELVEFGLGILTKLSSVASDVISGIGTYIGLEPPTDEAIALKLQEEEKQEEQRRRREEEILSLQAIRELERTGEIIPQNASAYPGSRRHSSLSALQRHEEEERLSRQFIEELARDGEISPPQVSLRGSRRTVRLVPGGRTEGHLRRRPGRSGDLNDLMTSAVGLLRLLELHPGNEESKRRLRELVISLEYMQSLPNDQYESLLSSMQDVKNPARNKEEMPVFIWKQKLDEKAPNEDAICNICLSNYEPGEEIKALPCLHKFHKKCIDQWFDSNNKCPICKLSVDNFQ